VTGETDFSTCSGANRKLHGLRLFRPLRNMEQRITPLLLFCFLSAVFRELSCSRDVVLEGLKAVAGRLDRRAPCVPIFVRSASHYKSLHGQSRCTTNFAS